MPCPTRLDRSPLGSVRAISHRADRSVGPAGASRQASGATGLRRSAAFAAAAAGSLGGGRERRSPRGPPAPKAEWSGHLVSLQPRIRLLRSFDQRSHGYLGYALAVAGTMAGQAGEFSVGIGAAAQARHELAVGDRVSGLAEPVADPRTEAVGHYRVSKLRLVERAPASAAQPPPWHGVPPALPVYRARGHRRLDARTYETRCASCLWGCRMAVEMIIDHWNPSKKRWRLETFCYGPKSCPLYRPGPTRKVPGRNGMSWEEEDWVDEEETRHRGADE